MKLRWKLGELYKGDGYWSEWAAPASVVRGGNFTTLAKVMTAILDAIDGRKAKPAETKDW